MSDLAAKYRSRLDQGTLSPDEDQKRAIAALYDLQKRILEKNAASPSLLSRFLKKDKKQIIKGVYLWGGVGRGKSMVMDLFHETLPDHIKARRIHFHEFMIETHDFLHAARQSDDSATDAAILKYAADIAAKTDVLCFDEFHVTDIADAMILMRLFTAFFKAGIACVTTSNWPPERLYEGGLQRERFLPFIDLLKQHMEITEMNGATDYRLRCLRESGVYFAPLGLASEKALDDLYKKLTYGASSYEEKLSVKGRNITVHETAKGVARFTFQQLCEKPLGAEDYLAIAGNYHTVFLENVPKLNYDRRNETKRLMTLIDAFYDQGTKLIISAEAKPENLYLGGAYEFEFERTVSRLIEMQSEDYLEAKAA